MEICYIVLAVISASFIFYILGKREGCRKTFIIAKKNNSNLIRQLINANLFATELREEERDRKEGDRLNRYIN
jgi:hypothetical protein